MKEPTPIYKWPSANQGFFHKFVAWLEQGGYGPSARKLYGCAARIALGWLDKAYWVIALPGDIDRVRAYITKRYASEATRATYLKGIAKLEDFLYETCHKPKPEKPINWPHYVGPLPRWLASDVRQYIVYRRRSWPRESWRRATITTLSHTCGFLRWAAQRDELPDATAITPALWHSYLDRRRAAGISPVTVNVELHELLGFLHFLAGREQPVCQKMLRVQAIDEGDPLPRAVPVDQLRLLLDEVERDAASDHAGVRLMGVMDRAWVAVMLYSGLRTIEVRRLTIPDLDMSERTIQVKNSKGLKDRVVFFNDVAERALREWLDVRGPAASEHVFIFHHRPLSVSYCYKRLCTYSERCGVRVTPHQLRHSMATLLVNAGAPFPTLQALMGHKHIETTLRYGRLYDATVAADYYRAVCQVEARVESPDGGNGNGNTGPLLALLDSLKNGTLNEVQRETVHALRLGILALTELATAHCGR
jgi:integrase/recombinase XerD